MIYRCHNPKSKSFKDYGARGIAVCARWRFGEAGMGGFECFLADVPARPSPLHSIDRRDNDGGYEPGNVRWATAKEQASNRRNTKRYLFKRRHLTASEISELTGVPRNVFFMRVERYGWTVSEAATAPVACRGGAPC